MSKRVVINSPDSLLPGGEKKENIYVFLAGPIQDAPEWQKEMPVIPGITWLNPRRMVIDRKTFDWNNQVKWETEALRIADYILFWVPLPEKGYSSLPEGRDYAQTTRMELLENLVRRGGKNIILGIEEGVHAKRYMEYKYKQYACRDICSSLSDCIDVLRSMICTRPDKVFFTSDTHFGSSRALEYSRRPFTDTYDMDWAMIERWNSKVSVGSKVYHLGDFGDYDKLKYLNGRVTLILGNYERSEKERLGLDMLDYSNYLKEKGFEDVIFSTSEDKVKCPDLTPVILGHEPLKVLDEINKSSGEYKYGLFGHIHGRQKVKPFGLDVGVDANDFAPISRKEAGFYINAIDKGFYDQEVYSK